MNASLKTILPLPILALFLFAFTFSSAPAQERIAQSKHNLSLTTETGAAAASRVCLPCHIPHQGSGAAGLWNPQGPGPAFLAFTSSTLKARPGQPSGASKLCLSCHDGTVAPGGLAGGGAAHDTHPISMRYPSGPAAARKHLTPAGALDSRVQLDDFSQVQCTTCHEPHDDQFGNFLVLDNQGAALCRVCHDYPGFATTAHATSRQTWNGTGINPWPHAVYDTVAANACLNCHTPHHAEGDASLLVRAPEEEVCLACHDGSVAPFNLAAVFQSPYHHPVERAQGVHRDGEDPVMTGDHVECTDCHNPHRARRASAVAPAVKGVLEGVSGVDTNGAPVREAIYEYQICFKCHNYTRRPPLDAIARRTPSFNLLRDFAPSNPSYHPVEAPGRNQDVPSLILPLTPASVIYCTDCHNNSQARSSMPGSAGPHGSGEESLLVARYRTGENVTESLTAYALCYRCHSRTSILANQSFPLHRLHVVDQHAPCSICHDSHGIDRDQGNRINNAHLINFDASIVLPDTITKRLEYRSLGVRTGQCFLRCHGQDHSPFAY